MNTKLYFHKTDGGAKYLCTQAIEGIDEGDLYSALVRLDGDPELLNPATAHAPELLKALEECSEYFAAIDEMQPSRKHGTKGDAIRVNVVAVIAKAKGE